MEEREFDDRADAVFDHIEMILEQVTLGLDYQLLSGGVLELEFDDDSKMVINRHRVGHEIWVADRSGGYHFRWNGLEWVDTRTGLGLMIHLTQQVSEQAGVAVRF